MSNTKFIVMDRKSNVRQLCSGTYRKVAVVEVEIGADPESITVRSRGLVRIIGLWDCLNSAEADGAYKRVLAKAEAMCSHLNA